MRNSEKTIGKIIGQSWDFKGFTLWKNQTWLKLEDAQFISIYHGDVPSESRISSRLPRLMTGGTSSMRVFRFVFTSSSSGSLGVKIEVISKLFPIATSKWTCTKNDSYDVILESLAASLHQHFWMVPNSFCKRQITHQTIHQMLLQCGAYKLVHKPQQL